MSLKYFLVFCHCCYQSNLLNLARRNIKSMRHSVRIEIKSDFLQTYCIYYYTTSGLIKNSIITSIWLKAISMVSSSRIKLLFNLTSLLTINFRMSQKKEILKGNAKEKCMNDTTHTHTHTHTHTYIYIYIYIYIYMGATWCSAIVSKLD